MDVGLVYYVTEWQCRGVFYVYCSLFWVDFDFMIFVYVIGYWFDFIGYLGVESFGQCIMIIMDVLGWVQYMFKYVQWGFFYYQCILEVVFVYWGGKIGWMWGKFGNWFIWENVCFVVLGDCYYKFWWIVCVWCIVDVWLFGCCCCICLVCRMLKCNDCLLFVVRGLFEWLPDLQMFLFMDWFQSQGHDFL